MMTEEQFKEQCAEILRKNITFAGQVGDYVIHGALDALWKLHTEQKLNKPDVSKSLTPHACPVCGGRCFMPNGFYNAQGHNGSTNSTAPEVCMACNATGLVWG